MDKALSVYKMHCSAYLPSCHNGHLHLDATIYLYAGQARARHVVTDFANTSYSPNWFLTKNNLLNRRTTRYLLVYAGKYLRSIHSIESVLHTAKVTTHLDIIALRQNAFYLVCA